MNLKKKKDYKSFQINVREKTEGVIKNGQSRETGNREVFSLIEYRKDVTQQWHRAQFPVAAGYFSLP
jgi:hypothetical protein